MRFAQIGTIAYSIVSVAEVASVFDSNYQQILDYSTARSYTLPSSFQQSQQNQLITDLKNYGIWDELDIFYVFATDASQEFAGVNWKDTGSYSSSLVNSPIFVQNSGFYYGASSYLDTSFTPSIDAFNYELNKASYILGVNLGTSSASDLINTSESTIYTNHFPSGSSNYFQWVINDQTARNAVSGYPTGSVFSALVQANRTHISSSILFVDGNSKHTHAAVSTRLDTGSLQLTGNPSLDIRTQLFGLGYISGSEFNMWEIWEGYSSSLESFNSEYTDVLRFAYDANYTVPDYPQQVKQNRLISNLKSASVWDSLDVLYVFSNNGSREFATINWKNTGSFQCSLVNSPTFSFNEGFRGDAVASYINTNYEPLADAVNFQLSSASFGAYIDNFGDNNGSDYDVGVQQGTSMIYLISKGYTDRPAYRAGINTSINNLQSGSSLFSSSLFHFQRSGQSSSMWINGSFISSSQTTNTSLPSDPIALLALPVNNSPSAFSKRRIRYFWAGHILTGSENVMYNIWNEYSSSLSSSFDPSYQLILDVASASGYTLPSYRNQTQQNTLLVQLKSASVWDTLDIFYVFATDASQEFATLNWKHPGSFSCSLVNSPTFSINEGFQGNGTTSYINTNWAPSDGIKFTETNASVFAQENINISSSGVLFGTHMAGTGGRATVLLPRNTNNTSSYTINASAGSVYTGSETLDSKGFWSLYRLSNEQNLYKDGISINLDTVASQTPSTNAMLLLADLGNGGVVNRSNRQISCFGLGSSGALTTGSLYNIWNQYSTSLSPHDIDYQRLLNVATTLGYTLPSKNQQVKQNLLIEQLKSASIWDKLDVFYNFATNGSQEFASLNWKAPNSFSCSLVNSPTFSINQGFTGDGATSYLDTGWNIANNGVNMTASSTALPGTGSVFHYISETVVEANVNDYGSRPSSGRETSFNSNNSSTQIQFGLMSVPFAINISGSIGFWHNQKSGSIHRIWKGGTLMTSSTATDAGGNSENFYILARNNTNTPDRFSAKTINCIGIGGPLVNKEVVLNNIWTTYSSSL